MSGRRAIQGIWLIERGSGRNLIAKAYTDIDIDMDLIAPFLSATHTFIDRASSEELQTIDTESNRYVWVANEVLLFVMVVSKGARLGHMRFILEYALAEFMRNEVPKNSDLSTMLKRWHGTTSTFKHFEEYVEELVSQYESTDESLTAGKAMDCLAVYSHLFRAILRVKVPKKTRIKLTKKIRQLAKPVFELDPVLSEIQIDDNGVEILHLDVSKINYRILRQGLEMMLQVVADATRKTVTKTAFRNMIFGQAMPYVKRDIKRLQLYYILDDVVRYLF
ncbi:MAG: hypothetical protein RTU09_04805 [Candidatus Thorarchaeota archaeon]